MAYPYQWQHWAGDTLMPSLSDQWFADARARGMSTAVAYLGSRLLAHASRGHAERVGIVLAGAPHRRWCLELDPEEMLTAIGDEETAARVWGRLLEVFSQWETRSSL